MVQIQGSEIGYGETSHPYLPVQFELARGETKWINFIRQVEVIALGNHVLVGVVKKVLKPGIRIDEVD